MLEKLIGFTIRNKFITGVALLSLVVAGILALSRLPVDAVPDITNNQVQVVTISPSFAPQEVEQIVTFPIEMALTNIPGIVEVRSISRYGLSVVTAVFEDQIPMLDARQYVREQITQVSEEMPSGAGKPQLMPITTGLGEIYQYILTVDPAYAGRYSPTDLRTIQDWILKRGMAGIPGVVDISSFGGYLKQVEVAVDPQLAASMGIGLTEVVEALERNNENTSGGYVESGDDAWYIRAEGLAKTTEEIQWIEVANKQGVPVLIRDIATIKEGHALRFGAMTANGEGEAVGGIALMLKGANASQTIELVKERVNMVQHTLPEGVKIEPFLDRSKLVARTTRTVTTNLLEGGVIVVLVLVLLLGNIRAGLIVASVIPLSMLFAFLMMNLFGVSANLMSLGALDFGIVVDGAVIIVESILHGLFHRHAGKTLTQSQMEEEVKESTAKIYQAAAFGVIIILVVFLPVLSLTGIEGKMFVPMAQTVSFAILGALLLSMTYVPMASAIFLSKTIPAQGNFSDRIMAWIHRAYSPTLMWAFRLRTMVMALAFGLLAMAGIIFSSMGGEFIPTLEEGDLAMQMTLPAGSTLASSVRATTQAEQILMDNFPEVLHVVSKIGTAEIPTDPMAVEDADIMIVLKEKDQWESASTREELVHKMKLKLQAVPRASFEFTQPIQLRFNELMTGAKADVAVKFFGPNLNTLAEIGEKAAETIKGIPGAADVKLEQTEGLPQLRVLPDRRAMAQFGVDIKDFNDLVRTAYLGANAGFYFDNDRRFDVVARLDSFSRSNLNLDQLFLPTQSGHRVPLSAVATIDTIKGPLMVSREKAQRRIVIGVNVRGRDVASLVGEIQKKLKQSLDLPPGYTIEYGGQFENLQAAKKRLAIALPISLFLIFILLYFSFGSVKHALLIYAAVPLSAIGGVFALWIRGLPFSISAGIGFIALFGVAVLNGIVLISHFNQLRKDQDLDLLELVKKGAASRLRPVLMTALVASLGFLPMALSNSAGAEVQRPLATVVIGGLITASFLTLILLPVLYVWVEGGFKKTNLSKVVLVVGVATGLFGLEVVAQRPINLDQSILHARSRNPEMQNHLLRIKQAEWESKLAFDPPQPSIDLTYGQINTFSWDYNVQISQGLGNIKQQVARSKIASTTLDLENARATEAIHHQEYQIRKAWNEWLFWRSALSLLNDQQSYWVKQSRMATLRLATGDISGMEHALTQTATNKSRLALERTKSSCLEAEQALREVAFLTQDTLVPDLDSLLPLARPKDSSSFAADVHLMARLKEQKQAEAITEHTAAERFPEFKIGYFQQGIDRVNGYKGLTMGVSLPIWGRAIRAQTEYQRLGSQIAENNYQYHQVILQERLSTSVRKLEAAKRAWDAAEEAADFAQKLMKATEASALVGNISYFELVQSLSLATDLELERLTALRDYNACILDFLFLTQPTTRP